jgi:Calcineurin-like phosphoesterase/Purple acid Phosphatase, N-terminal domain
MNRHNGARGAPRRETNVRGSAAGGFSARRADRLGQYSRGRITTMNRRWTVRAFAALAIVAAFAVGTLADASVASASQPQLTRYPYLTDVVSSGSTYNATINWATNQSQTTGYATYGQAGVEPVTAHRANGSKTSISVNGVAEYQWKAKVTGLLPATTYAYRVYFNSPVVDLLGTDASPVFTTTPAAGAPGSYSFAVLGDWGATNSSGTNPDQANLMAQIARSGASFILSAGDVGYPSGNQTNYGDLNQTGPNISDVFAPSFYAFVGDGIPMFGAPGNHGFTSTFLNIWPEPTAPVLSGGTYQMSSYSVPGTNTASYPAAWYAFSIGNARFYVLTAAWANSNVGSGTLYSDDYAAHWTPTSPEYTWLANDLATHPAQLKFAVFHFPMYTDNATEATDTYLHGPNSLAALLTQYGVQFVFNGHAHIYERNLQQPGESFVSYVFGGGGETLEPVGQHGTSPFDAYGIGWSYSKNIGSATGSAKPPASPAQVFSYGLVTVGPNQVTVAPINSLGQSFDVVTYPY